jgi:hypothetical protein
MKYDFRITTDFIRFKFKIPPITKARRSITKNLSKPIPNPKPFFLILILILIVIVILRLNLILILILILILKLFL